MRQKNEKWVGTISESQRTYPWTHDSKKEKKVQDTTMQAQAKILNML